MTEALQMNADLVITLLYKLWMPMLAWTFAAWSLWFFVQKHGTRHPVFRYHVLRVLILLLPIGLLAVAWIPSPFSKNDLANKIEATSPPANIAPTLPAPFLPNPVPPSIPQPDIQNPPINFSWRLVLDWGILCLTAFAVIFGLMRFVQLFREHYALSRFKEEVFHLPPDIEKAVIHSLELPQNIVLTHTKSIETPLTFGWPEAYIVLPTTLITDEEARRLAILHELCHIRHHDFLQQYLLRGLDAVFAINPMMRYLILQLEAERELIRDEEVVRHPDVSSYAYASNLYKLATTQDPLFITS
ncbi:MAG: M56 family metallopeptidase [Bacteroidetes Order II. Incertae sedis bacterium]|nr:M56 family metallopeptidase [Bacteroidetes Order II. bacterium]